MKDFRLEFLTILLVTIFFCISLYSSQSFGNSCKQIFNKFSMPLLIEKKALGKSHTQEEISYIIKGATDNTIPDYQMAAWLMSIRLNGATRQETGFLTKAMVESGDILKFNTLSKPIVDKHSTGGVGDKTSLVLAPLCASCDLNVPMISGRGLGHTGGTLDKLESLTNFNTNLSLQDMQKQIQDVGVFISGQTNNLVPADKKLYNLRDVTATVSSVPLITSSIMSKKIAEGLDALVMDIKFGSGALLKTIQEARQLADELKYVAEYNNVKFRGLITNMDQPLGRFIGNSLEVREALDILRNEIPVEKQEFYNSTKDLSLHLVAHMLELTGKVKSIEEGLQLAQSKLEDGSAFKVFEKMCRAQGTCNLDLSNDSVQTHKVLSPASGYVSSMKTSDIGMASIFLGAGRQKKEDVIDHNVGIEMNVRLGDVVKKGDPLAIFYYSKESDLKKGEEFFIQAIRFSDSKPKAVSLIEDIIN